MQTWYLSRLALLLAAAVGMTAVTYGILWLVAPRDSYLYAFFFERSLIQHASTFLFWLTMGILFAKHRDHLLEVQGSRRAAEILEDAGSESSLIWSHALSVRDRFQQEQDRRFQRSLIFRRIVRALDRLHATQSTNAMEDYLRTCSDQDSAELDTSYAGLRYCVWLLPTLGFVGTVMGISLGITQFAGIIQDASSFQAIKSELPTVTGALGTAFDTTLLALVYSAIAVFYMSILLKHQEQALEDNDRLAFDGLGSLFQEHSTASESIIHAIHENVEQISSRMNGNRGALEALIRYEMPALVGDGVAAPVRSLEQSVTLLLQQLAISVSQAVDAQAQLREQISSDMRKIYSAQLRSNKEVADALQQLQKALVELRRGE